MTIWTYVLRLLELGLRLSEANLSSLRMLSTRAAALAASAMAAPRCWALVGALLGLLLGLLAGSALPDMTVATTSCDAVSCSLRLLVQGQR